MRKFKRLLSPASFVSLAFLNVMFIFVMLSEPLGDAAESLMIKMAAPFQARYLYDDPKSPLAYTFQHQDESKFWSKNKVLLLTLDDLEVQSTGTPYPFSYAKYADDLRLAYQLEAKAIFIDLLITDERGTDSGIEYLLNTICEINETTPVFLASTRFSGQNFDPTPMHPVLVKHSNFQNKNQVCFQEVSVALSDKAGEHKFWYYPLYETKKTAKSEQENNSTYLPSAGLAIYNRFAQEKGLSKIEVQEIAETDDTMALTWGATPADFNVDFERDRINNGQVRNCRFEKSVFEYLSFLPFLSYKFEEKDLPLCPYFPETRPGFLAALESSDEKGKQAARELVKGSLVVYSVNLTGVSDIVNSPVHGTISGAHYHAMAFHNFNRFGAGYIRSAEIEFSNLGSFFNLETPEDIATSILLALVVTLTAASILIRGWLKYEAPEKSPWLSPSLNLLHKQLKFHHKLVLFPLFLFYRLSVFLLKTAAYIALACGVVIAISQYYLLDPFIWIEAATLVTLLFASNAIGNLFEQFIEKTSEEEEQYS